MVNMRFEDRPKVVLDSNCLYNDFQLANLSLDRLLRFCRTLDIHVAIPDIVAKELVRQEFVRQEEGKAKFKSWAEGATNKLRRIAGLSSSTTKEVRHEVTERLAQLPDLDELGEEFADRCKERGLTILEPPGLETSNQLSDDYFRRCKPFKSDGDGLGDWLVWASICEVATAHQVTHFITDNWRDFAEGPDSQECHPDLMAGLGEGAHVSLWRNINLFLQGMARERGAEDDEDFLDQMEQLRFETHAIQAVCDFAATATEDDLSSAALDTLGLDEDSSFELVDVDVDQDSASWQVTESLDTDEEIGQGEVDALVVAHIGVPLDKLNEFSNSHSTFEPQNLDPLTNQVVYEAEFRIHFTADIRASRHDANVLDSYVEAELA